MSSLFTVIVALLGLTACAGKSTSHGGDDDGGVGGSSSGASGGTAGKGSTGATGGTAPGAGGTGGTVPGAGGTTPSKGGTAGTASEGGLSVEVLRQTSIERVDLLLMIDNSIGMAAKQHLLSEALPVLVNRLTEPACVNENGEFITNGGEDCPAGSAVQFRPVTDLHVGVVSSSLGSHGGDQCAAEEKNDYAQLMGTRRAGLPSWNNRGFLSWDPDGTHDPSGESDPNAFDEALRSHAMGVGETGCGYEASLEAWYRFLIDPEPVTDMTNDSTFSVRGAINGAVLAQRDAFLRSDSAVIIVMLSDENDCSILDENGSQGWLVGLTGTAQSPFRMPRASSSCAANPNDACCRLCVADPVAGCPDNGADAECAKGISLTSTQEDHPNLRCFKHMQRFGVDLLYPTARYVEGLTSTTLQTREGNLVPNPLFTPRNGSPPRDPSAVLLVGIVGVPWQDLSDPAEYGARELRLLSAEQLAAPDPLLMGHSRWDLMLGSAGDFPPMDPFMIEQIEPRPDGAQHPLASGPDYAIANSSAQGLVNVINGHEQNVLSGDDLQYACIFPLREPVACDPPAAMGNDVGCDCNSGAEYDYNRPTCRYSDDPSADGVQEYESAYPGVRQLEVLRDLGPQAVVGSICPKITSPEGTPETDPYYGYNPIVHAVANRFGDLATPGCLPRPLSVDEAGAIPCRVVRTISPPDCACDAPGQRALNESDDATLLTAVRDHLVRAGHCGESTGVDCQQMCSCELPQLEGDAREACTSGEEVTDGFCYVDSGPLVAQCPADARRMLRLPPIEAAQGSSVILVCGESL